MSANISIPELTEFLLGEDQLNSYGFFYDSNLGEFISLHSTGTKIGLFVYSDKQDKTVPKRVMEAGKVRFRKARKQAIDLFVINNEDPHFVINGVGYQLLDSNITQPANTLWAVGGVTCEIGSGTVDGLIKYLHSHFKHLLDLSPCLEAWVNAHVESALHIA